MICDKSLIEYIYYEHNFLSSQYIKNIRVITSLLFTGI